MKRWSVLCGLLGATAASVPSVGQTVIYQTSFESADDLVGWGSHPGMISVSTDRAHSGMSSLKLNTGQIGEAGTSYELSQSEWYGNVTVSAWVYDDMKMGGVGNGRDIMLGVLAPFWGPTHHYRVGTSVIHPLNYLLYTITPGGEDWYLGDVPLVRSLGWHELRIEMTETGTRFLVDGQQRGPVVESLHASNIMARVSLIEGYSNPPGEYIYWDDVVVTRTPDVIQIDIDIKPGSGENPINLGSNGVTPVAILSNGGFDAAMVDDSTVTMAGAALDKIPRLEDVDGDGDEDLVCHFRTQDLDLDATSVEAVLTGMTIDGTLFEGSDVVRIVPSKGKKKGKK